MKNAKVPDLSKIHFFKPVAGKTLREQLAGKKLAGPEVVEHMLHLAFGGEYLLETFEPPTRWGKKPTGSDTICAFSLLRPVLFHPHSDCHRVEGFLWAPAFVPWGINGCCHYYHGDLLDLMVVKKRKHPEEWVEDSWVLIEEE